MPDLSLVHVVLLFGMLLVGFVLGYALKGSRTQREKISINAAWQAQIDSQQSEHDRLAAQSKSLMEQVNQYQASHKDSKMRARELSDSLREAFERRDELQRKMKDIRGNLEVAIEQRDKLQTNAEENTQRGELGEVALRKKNDEIEYLRKELGNWQERVPPLIEKFRERALEVQQLEIELQKAGERIQLLEDMSRGEHTTIEPVDTSNMPDGMDASNEPHTETSVQTFAALDDQIIDEEENSDPVLQEAIAEVRDAVAEHASIGQELEAVAEEAEESAADPADDPAVHEEIESSDDSYYVPASDDHATGMYAPDDLKQIKGVGPAIEKLLNDLGIFRFTQIAEMSEFEIDRVAQQLKGFRSRIYREDWIGQARILQYEKKAR